MSKNPITVSVLVISYNTREMTVECIRSVFSETTRTQFEVIVIDNASRDGSAEAISFEFGDDIELISSKKNLGFAEANNVAAQSATGEYILLLNPDTIVLDGAIDSLIEFATGNPRSLIWGGRTVFADGSLNPASAWARQTLWSLFAQAVGLTVLFRNTSLFNPEGIGGWDRTTARDVDIVSGCFFLIRRDLWGRLKGFNQQFFMYGEDADICLRAKKLGVAPRINPKATIIHYGGASERHKSEKMCRLLAAKSLLIEKHFRPSQHRLGLFLLSLFPLSRAIVHGLISPLRSQSRDACREWYRAWHERKHWLRGNFKDSQ